MTMRLCNSRLPSEHFVCYQTSQRNLVIIKVLYRCLRKYLLGWRISRLGFVTPNVGEVSQGLLGNAHHISLASIATNKIVASVGERSRNSKFSYVSPRSIYGETSNEGKESA